MSENQENDLLKSSVRLLQKLRGGAFKTLFNVQGYIFHNLFSKIQTTVHGNKQFCKELPH